MALLLALASLAIAGKVVGEIASDARKVPARSKIKEDSKNGTLDVVKNFEEILHICNVKRKSHGSSSVKVMINCEYEVVRFEHIDVFVDYEDVEMKVNDICNTTFLGDFVVGDVKIKLNSSGNSFTEVWALKVPVAMKFSLKQYYNACAERCGYIY